MTLQRQELEQLQAWMSLVDREMRKRGCDSPNVVRVGKKIQAASGVDFDVEEFGLHMENLGHVGRLIRGRLDQCGMSSGATG